MSTGYTLRYAVTQPSDLAEIFRRRAAMCRQAEATTSVKSSVRDWRQQAMVWEECAAIAAASFLAPPVDAVSVSVALPTSKTEPWSCVAPNAEGNHE